MQLLSYRAARKDPLFNELAKRWELERDNKKKLISSEFYLAQVNTE
jgi:hypothetical protein